MSYLIFFNKIVFYLRDLYLGSDILEKALNGLEGFDILKFDYEL
jgi:hypothetical protein